MKQLKVGQRVKLLDKTYGCPKSESYAWERAQEGHTVYITRVYEDNYAVWSEKDAIGGDYYAFGDVVPYSPIEEDSEEL